MVVLLRGGGDLASGVAIRLFRVGVQVLITEVEEPMAVRRLVSFSEAIYDGQTRVEEVTAVRVVRLDQAKEIWARMEIPVMVDPEARCREILRPHVLVDGRMTKRPPDLGMDAAPMVIGLGPGFDAGTNCHVVVETMRGHTLGRVIWQGQALSDTGIPDAVAGKRGERVLRSPADGIFHVHVEIGDRIESGQMLADVAGSDIRAPFQGILRGLSRPGIFVRKGMKVGDVDPRGDPLFCRLVSDKSLAVGGGVMEAILSRSDLRSLISRPEGSTRH